MPDSSIARHAAFCIASRGAAVHGPWHASPHTRSRGSRPARTLSNGGREGHPTNISNNLSSKRSPGGNPLKNSSAIVHQEQRASGKPIRCSVRAFRIPSPRQTTPRNSSTSAPRGSVQQSIRRGRSSGPGTSVPIMNDEFLGQLRTLPQQWPRLIWRLRL